MTRTATQAVTVGVDLGGTKLALALADPQGALIARSQRPTAASGDARADVDAIIRDIRDLLAESGRSTADVERVGLSVPGPIDLERGVLLDPPNLHGWGEVPIRDWVEDALGRPVAIENDANAAALAEWKLGAGQGRQHLVFLTMSTGIGAGLILDGRLYRGLHGNAGEFGHVAVEWDGDPCACGMRGCLEAYVGGAAWTRRLRERCPADSRVAQLAGGREHAKPEHWVIAAGEGDRFALAEFEHFNAYLARGIATIAFALAPEIIVLGTIPTAAGEKLCFEPLRDRVRELVWPVLGRELQVVPAGLGADLPYRAGIGVAMSSAGSRS